MTQMLVPTSTTNIDIGFIDSNTLCFVHCRRIAEQKISVELQVISLQRAVMLPLLALVIGSLIAHSLPGPQTLFDFSKAFFENLIIIGVIGVVISVLTID